MITIDRDAEFLECTLCHHMFRPQEEFYKEPKYGCWIRRCKRCVANRRRKYRMMERGEWRPKEAKRMDLVTYEFDMARSIFGFTYEETVNWLDRYRREDETPEEWKDTLRRWQLNPMRKQSWQPDVI